MKERDARRNLTWGSLAAHAHERRVATAEALSDEEVEQMVDRALLAMDSTSGEPRSAVPGSTSQRTPRVSTVAPRRAVRRFAGPAAAVMAVAAALVLALVPEQHREGQLPPYTLEVLSVEQGVRGIAEARPLAGTHPEEPDEMIGDRSDGIDKALELTLGSELALVLRSTEPAERPVRVATVAKHQGGQQAPIVFDVERSPRGDLRLRTMLAAGAPWRPGCWTLNLQVFLSEGTAQSRSAPPLSLMIYLKGTEPAEGGRAPEGTGRPHCPRATPQLP